jgi:hypothetical protein
MEKMGNDTGTTQSPAAVNPGDLTPEQQKLINDLTKPIIDGLAEVGLNMTSWLKGVVKLTKAKSLTRIKVKGGVKADEKLQRGAKVIVKGGDEDVVEVKDPDNQVRNAALQYIGKITQWQPPERSKVELPPGELTLVYNVPKEPEVKVTLDGPQKT